MGVSELLFPSGSLSVSVDETSEVVKEFGGRQTSFGYEHLSVLEQSGVERTAAGAGVCSNGYDIHAQGFRNEKGTGITFAARTQRSGDELAQKACRDVAERLGTIRLEVRCKLPVKS